MFCHLAGQSFAQLFALQNLGAWAAVLPARRSPSTGAFGRSRHATISRLSGRQVQRELHTWRHWSPTRAESAYGLRDIGRQQEWWTIYLHAPFARCRIRRKFTCRDCLQVCTTPTRFRKQRVNNRKRADAPFDCTLEAVRRVSLRNSDDGLYVGKGIFASVLCLPSQSDDLLLRALLFGNVSRDF